MSCWNRWTSFVATKTSRLHAPLSLDPRQGNNLSQHKSTGRRLLFVLHFPSFFSHAWLHSRPKQDRPGCREQRSKVASTILRLPFFISIQYSSFLLSGFSAQKWWRLKMFYFAPFLSHGSQEQHLFLERRSCYYSATHSWYLHHVNVSPR